MNDNPGSDLVDIQHPPVHWRNLKYDFKDNGRPVLFNDLTGVELILLMEEMDAELRRS